MNDLSKYNVGWALLKLWMCWEVVMVHAWNAWSYPGHATPPAMVLVRDFRDYAVPVFMLMTFFLAARHFAANDGEWLKRRFIRLCLPFAFWSVLAFVTWRLLSPHFPAFATDPSNGAFWKEGCKSAPEPVAFKYLLLQALGTTRTLGSQMWFQAVLVILTGVFAVFFRFVKPRFVVAGLVALLVLGIMLDYSGLNFRLFESFRYEVRNPLGRIFPMMPYAAIGLMAGSRTPAVDGFLSRHRWTMAALGAAVTAFLLKYEVFVSPPGFFYRGLKMLTVALALTTLFRALPLERLPVIVRRVLVWASGYSMGVYFAHIYVGKLLEELAFPHIGIVPRSFSGGCVVFAVSFAVCWLVARVPNRHVRALVT